MTENELVVREQVGSRLVPLMTDDEIERTFRIAKALAMSGMFKDAKQAEQAFAKILLGRDLGLSPTRSMVAIHIVEGKPEVSATTLAGFVQQHPDYDYEVLERSNERCRIEFFRVLPESKVSLGKIEWNLDDTRLAKLENKDNHKKYPAAMNFARAMSAGVRTYCPEVTNGVPVYHEGEIERPLLNAGAPISSEATELPSPVDLPPAVEDRIERARRLGHAGHADRDKIEMLLGGQDEDAVKGWCERVDAALDEMEAVETVGNMLSPANQEKAQDEFDAAVDLADQDKSDFRAEDLADKIAGAEADGDQALADGLREQLDALEAERAGKVTEDTEGLF